MSDYSINSATKMNDALTITKYWLLGFTPQVGTYAERKKQRKLLAGQLVGFAKGGVLPTTGTPLLVQAETARKGERDIWFMQYSYRLCLQ